VLSELEKLAWSVRSLARPATSRRMPSSSCACDLTGSCESLI
jgi:hypothetical protein